MSKNNEQLSFLEPIENEVEKYNLNNWISIKYERKHKIVNLFYHGNYVKQVNLKDKVERKLFFIELVQIGAKQARIAEVFGISRQTLHNYLETKRRLGVEALIHS